MGAEENSLRDKSLYKIELYLLKVMPMLLAAIYLINTVLSYYDIILPVLSYIGGLSLIPLVLDVLTDLSYDPSFLVDLYVNYDCDPQRSDLMESLYKSVSELNNSYYF